MLLSEGQMSDYKGAALMIDAFPRSKALLADRGLRCRLVPSRLGRAWHRCLHPVKDQPQSAHPARHSPLSPAPSDREHVRQTQGLAPDPHPLRPMHPHVHVRHLHRSNRHLLATAISPEPRCTETLTASLTRGEVRTDCQQRIGRPENAVKRAKACIAGNSGPYCRTASRSGLSVSDSESQNQKALSRSHHELGYRPQNGSGQV